MLEGKVKLRQHKIYRAVSAMVIDIHAYKQRQMEAMRIGCEFRMHTNAAALSPNHLLR